MTLRKLSLPGPAKKRAPQAGGEKYRRGAAEPCRHCGLLEALVAKRTEQLRRSELLYRTLVENVPAVIARYDKDFRYIYRSPQGDDTLAGGSAGLAGKSWQELGIPPALCRQWREKFSAALDTGRAVEFETSLPNRTGVTRHYLVRVRPETGRNGSVESLLAVALDITERKRLAAELQRLDRLNVVGEMAAAIGHEVRNPLTTVRGYLQLFQRKAQTAGYSSRLRMMIEELDRVNAIISGFLSLARNKALDLKSHNLNDIVTALLPLLEADARCSGHDVRFDADELPAVAIDDRDIRQLILNLARNAFEAMPPGGLLTITTSAGDGRVVLTVRDTGRGIPEKLLDRLGTPFLTTKENCIGLGLAVCYRIVQRHGAAMAVDTSPQGTTFRVSFKTGKQ